MFGPTSLHEFPTHILTANQLAILNASSILGRIIPNMLVPKYGVFNLLIFSGVACAAVIFALFGISTTTGIIIFAILSGFSSGACTYVIMKNARLLLLSMHSDLSVIGVAIALHAHDPAEIG